MSKRLIVTGGDGFVGRHICRIAVAEGHDVLSIARSGRGNIEGEWAESVEWLEANVLQPETYRDRLAGADAVIHCVGSVREHRKNGETFERINEDSTEIVGWEAEHAGVPRFVFMSADTPRPLVPDRFIEAKRRAEASLRSAQIRESVLRPAFIYGPDRPASVVGARLLQAAEYVPGLQSIVHPTRPLRVEQVALAAVRAATDEGYDGVISVDNIEFLAGDDWKRYVDAPTNGQAARRKRNLVLGGVAAGTLAGVAWRVLARQSGR